MGQVCSAVLFNFILTLIKPTGHTDLDNRFNEYNPSIPWIGFDLFSRLL